MKKELGHLLGSRKDEEVGTIGVKDRVGEHKIREEESIWEELRRYGVDNKELEEFSEGMRTLVEEGSLSKGSHRVYKGAIRRYREWAKGSRLMKGIPSWPVKPVAMAIYLTYLWKEKKSFPTMRGALFAIKWIHKVEGWADPGESPVIRQLIRAAVLGLYRSMSRKHALNKGQVLNLIGAARKRVVGGAVSFEVFPVIMLSQWFGIARISEVVGLKRKDISFRKEGGMDIKYRGKNANTANLRRREGDTKYYEEIGGEHCPTTVMMTFLESRGLLELEGKDKRWEQGIFQVGGKPLSYQWYSTRLKGLLRECGLPEELFASHSFRSGAAMMALANGASKEAVKRQGGWLSDAIDVYFIPTLTDLLAPGKALRL